MAKTKRSQLTTYFIKEEYEGLFSVLFIKFQQVLDLTYEQREGLKGMSYSTLLNAFQIVSI